VRDGERSRGSWEGEEGTMGSGAEGRMSGEGGRTVHRERLHYSLK
jgi:hypothetical protein